jgi:hypothetical protein
VGVAGAADGVSGPKSGAGLGAAGGCSLRYHKVLTTPAAKNTIATRRKRIGRAEPAWERCWDGEGVGMGTPRGGSAPKTGLILGVPRDVVNKPRNLDSIGEMSR